MTDIKLRDYIATQAMQILLKQFRPGNYDIRHIVKDAYAVADAMVLESSK